MSYTDVERRILKAARSCFVQSGFHRTTMQQVAAVAGMSAGNLYRYFPSKDAIVAGLCAMDRTELADSLNVLDTARNTLEALAGLARRFLIDEPREQAIMATEIWAEASRSPSIRALVLVSEREIRQVLMDCFEKLRAQGRCTPDLDAEALADFLMSTTDGIIVRRARDPDYDPTASVDHMLQILTMAFAGEIPTLRLADPPKARASA